jgi:DNA-directed RNA polymerase subunit RPC12/RpoP
VCCPFCGQKLARTALRIVRQESSAMADKPARCPKCNGSMEEGKAHDFRWVPVSWNASWFAQVSRAIRATAVVGHRCKECGYLELYAKP